jgi:hypothetical protein
MTAAYSYLGSNKGNIMLNYWNKFEAWINSWFPGLKTYLTTGLGALGMSAGVLQEYVTGLPMEQWISSKTLALVSAGLFTLSFWFKNMGERVDARK